MKKRLVYHLYVPYMFETLITYKLHMLLLKKYSNIFDESVFVIAVDERINNDTTIYNTEREILDCGFRNVTFKVIDNSKWREAITFYNEIATKLKYLDGITMFGHSKGLFDEVMFCENKEYDYLKDPLLYWITSMYYLNLSPVSLKDLEYSFLKDKKLCYGALRQKVSDVSIIKNSYIYSGSFFWVNGQRLYEYLKDTKQEVPMLTDLYNAEDFCGKLVPIKSSGSFGEVTRELLEDNFDPYRTKGIIKDYFLNENNYNIYNKFHKDITKGLVTYEE